MAIDQIEIRCPDDWHLHLRDGEILNSVARESSAVFARAIVMPNLVPPILNCRDAEAYRRRILDAVPTGNEFTPLMTLFLTEDTSPGEIERGYRDGLITAVKLYPANATTNSANGVKQIERAYPVLDKLAQLGIPLLVHGEVAEPEVDIFDREAVFIDRILKPVRNRFPELRIVLEHVTTSQGVDYVASTEGSVAATITVHHLILNRNSLLAGGIRPHFYCLPVVKRERHRLALRAAATSGNPRFFLGTDSAPHSVAAKESDCGCAGIFTAPNALAWLAQVFEEENALNRLEGFASISGAEFYGFRPNESRVCLARHKVPVKYSKRLRTGGAEIEVFDPGVPLYWTVESRSNGHVVRPEIRDTENG